MKLSEVTGGSSAPATGTMKLSQVMKKPRSASASDQSGNPPAASPQMPWYDRALHGFEGPLVGADTLVSELEQHLPFVPKETAASDLAASLRHQREWEQGAPAGFDWAEAVGDLANPLNYVLGGRGLMGAALAGAGAAAMQPSPTTDYWREKAKQVAEGAGIGGATGFVGRAVGRAVAPTVSAGARALAAKGVPMTAGQILGGPARTAESALRSFPFLGDFIRKAENHSMAGFDRAVTNQALEPIGVKLPKTVDAGHDAVKYAAQKIGERFDRLWPRVNFRPDPQFMRDLSGLQQLVSELPPDQQSIVRAFLTNRIDSRFGPGFRIDGADLARIDAELGQKAASYRRAADPAQREVSQVLTELRDMLRDAVERQHPNEARQLRDARSAYAMLVRIEDATARRAGSTGIFTPRDLLAAIRSGSSRARRRDFAHGDGLLQAFAETGQNVLPEKIGDSGTVGRGLWDMALMGGAFFHQPGVLAPEALIPLYTRRGGEAAQRYLIPGATRKRAADAISKAIARSAPVASALYSNLLR